MVDIMQKKLEVSSIREFLKILKFVKQYDFFKYLH